MHTKGGALDVTNFMRRFLRTFDSVAQVFDLPSINPIKNRDFCVEIIGLVLAIKKLCFSWGFLQNSPGIPLSETNKSKFVRPPIVEFVLFSFIFGGTNLGIRPHLICVVGSSEKLCIKWRFSRPYRHCSRTVEASMPF